MHAHFDDLEEQRILSREKAKFAKSLVDKRDMTAIFAFYKFSHNDVALRSYLDFKHAAIEKQAALHRNKKKREKYLLERAASYEAFLEERRNLLAATKPRARPIRSESPSPPQKPKPAPKKKKKKKPRWALLYEDALRRITTVKALGAKTSIQNMYLYCRTHPLRFLYPLPTIVYRVFNGSLTSCQNCERCWGDRERETKKF